MKMFLLRSSVVFVSILCFLSGASVEAVSQDYRGNKIGLARLDAQAAGISSYLLPNGFKIILVPYPSAANARVELLVKTGSKQEGYGETGMAHLLEHMLFKSAGKRINLKSDLTALGASWNGTTDADRTNFFETVAADPEKIDEVLRIEADRFIRATFTKEHLASEMTVVRNELEKDDSDPGSLVMRSLLRQSFFWHGYSRPTIGARSDIEDAPFSALVAFHKKYYRPDNAALIVSGNFDPARVLALASQLFSVARNPASPAVVSWTRDESRAVTNRSELFAPAGQTMAASAWKLPGETDRQTHAFDLAVSAICDTDWGSLRKDLVLERKIAVTVSCNTSIRPDYSLLIATASSGKGDDAEVLSKALRDHIESAASQGITQAQLERARTEELNAYDRLENLPGRLAAELSKAEVAGDWRLFFWQRDMVKAISLDEANAALKKWAVAVNRSDVLLHHVDRVTPPEPPKRSEARDLVAGKDWPAIARVADPLPDSAIELAKATVNIPLDGTRARAALIPRKTQGDLAWLVLRNDFGNETALAGRSAACSIADRLMDYGGAGLNRDELGVKLEALKAKATLGLGRLVIEAPHQNILPALDLLLQTWAAPALPEAEFERIQAAAIAHLESELHEPASVAATAARLRFDNYPQQHPFRPISIEQQIEAMRDVRFSDVTKCVADFSGIAQVRLAMVGAFSPQDVQTAWSKIAKLPVAKVAYERVKDVAIPAAVDTTPIVVSMPEHPNATVAGVTVLGVNDESPDFPALRIAMKVLGGDADSRIWKRLREHDGLAYSANASLAPGHFEPRSSLVIMATAASNRSDEALASLKDELALALRNGFSEKEVELAKHTWLQERKTSLRSEESFASNLAQGLYSGQDYAWFAEYSEKIAQLSADDVTRALRKYLADAPVVWMVGRGSS